MANVQAARTFDPEQFEEGSYVQHLSVYLKIGTFVEYAKPEEEGTAIGLIVDYDRDSRKFKIQQYHR